MAMTAEEATRFNGFSGQNAAALIHASEQRKCRCEPYLDWFTYKRWRAQGYRVRKGEHGIHLITFIPVIREQDGQRLQVGSRPWTSVVFCRCQVEPV